ncbi:MAG TPA: hypothetical protein VJC18_08115, partial [bacterium]|nr:hypothetical protein [bacterium]
KPRVAGASLISHSLRPRDLHENQQVIYVRFPHLTQYPTDIIVARLKKLFSEVTVIDYSSWEAPVVSPLAGYLRHFDEQKNVEGLCELISRKAAQVPLIFLPPVLGIKHHFVHHQLCQQKTGAKVVELLSTLPSSAGLRLTHLLDDRLNQLGIECVTGEACPFACTDDVSAGLPIRGGCQGGSDRPHLRANVYLLATGKYVGGGVKAQSFFSEPITRAPLYLDGRAVSPSANMTQLVTPQADLSQDFMRLGVSLSQNSKNIKYCGHVLAGFDYTREGCGFGVSMASALSCFS